MISFKAFYLLLWMYSNKEHMPWHMFCSVLSDTVMPWTAAHQTSLSFTISQSLLNSCLLSWWCHPTISSSVIPISSCFQSFAASGSFPVSRLFASDGQSIGVLASASVLPVNIQGWGDCRGMVKTMHCGARLSWMKSCHTLLLSGWSCVLSNFSVPWLLYL